jgi:hypothetical protein
MRHVISGFVAAVLLLAATTASAQIFAGSVSGIVKDQQGGVLPGVTVSLTGKTGAKTAVTDANGIYRFPAVDPGSYVVSAELAGFKVAKQENVTVTVGSALDVPFTMTVGGVSENINVVGAAPIVDVKSSSTQTEVSQELLYNAPITRTAINVFNVMPGANSASVYGGESGTANALLIDGVDTRDPEGGSAWTFYNYNMVQEVQIQGLGAPAEYGGFTGAVVNTITKSGGNRYSGLFDVLGSNSSLGSNNVTPEIVAKNPALGSPAVTKKYIDFTTQLGGPIKQDKLFYFFSAQRFQQDTDPSGPSTIRHEVSPRFNAKLTWQPTSNDNYMLSLQYDGYNIIGRAGVSALLATDALTNREDAPEIVWLGQWRHVFNSQTFAEVKYTGWWGYYDLNPEVNLPAHVDGLTGLPSISQGWHYYADRGRDQVNASVSHYADKFGKHELKFGAEFEHSKVRNRYGYASNANFPNGVYYYDYGGAPYLAYSYGYDVTATNNRTSAFVQDSWKVGDRLTINPGVRLDLIRGSNPQVGQVYSANNFAPRLGFAWDVTGDYNTVVKGAYSQYYEGAMATTFERGIPGVSPRLIYDVTGSKPQLIDTHTIPIYKIDPDIKHPRVDEVYGAVERALGGSMRFTVTGIYRENKNFINSISPNATWTPVTVTNGLTNAPLTLYKWANRAATQSDFLIRNIAGYQYRDPSGNLIGTADPFRKYKAAMFVLNKRLTKRWTTQVSYIVSEATGTVDNTGGSQVASRQFETPVLALVNVDGHLTNDRTHEFKVLGSYTIPVIEVALNGYWHMISGRTYTPFQQFTSSVLGLSGQSSSYRRPLLEPRGTERNPAERIVDLSFEKVIPLTGRDRLGVYMQILNAFNASTITSTQNRVPNVSIAGVENPVLYGAPGTIFAARQINIGARWSF